MMDGWMDGLQCNIAVQQTFGGSNDELLEKKLCMFSSECHWLVPVQKKYTATNVIQGTDHPQAADTDLGRARPCLPPLQLHLHCQQLDARARVCALQAKQTVWSCPSQVR